jgi:hypothetical protein
MMSMMPSLPLKKCTLVVLVGLKGVSVVSPIGSWKILPSIEREEYQQLIPLPVLKPHPSSSAVNLIRYT